jgi:hypothetical protein
LFHGLSWRTNHILLLSPMKIKNTSFIAEYSSSYFKVNEKPVADWLIQIM